jgi:hypothetical protein
MLSCMLVHPASPAPVAAAPASSKNSRRSIDTFGTVPTSGCGLTFGPELGERDLGGGLLTG